MNKRPSMIDSGDEPNSGFLHIRKWVWGVVVVSLFVVALLLFIPAQKETESAIILKNSGSLEKSASEFPAPQPTQKSVFPPDPPRSNNNSPWVEEPEFEEAIFEDELTVVLLFHPNLGQISVERYDSNGNPTGEPLKSGTQVQIPNPNKPGEKIYFRVP